MKFSALLSLSFAAVAVTAIDTAPIFALPKCPRDCIFSTLKKAPSLGCPTPTPKCLCHNDRYKAALESCARSCSPNEVDQMRKVGNKLCQDADPIFASPAPSPIDTVITTTVAVTSDTGKEPSSILLSSTGAFPTDLDPHSLPTSSNRITASAVSSRMPTSSAKIRTEPNPAHPTPSPETFQGSGNALAPLSLIYSVFTSIAVILLLG